MNLRKIFFERNTIRQEIVKNTFWLMLAEVTARILSFFLAVWVARYLGAANYGKYNFSFSFVSLFVVLTDFGLSTLSIREISRNKTLAQKYFNNIVLVKFFLSLLTLVTIMVITQCLGKTEEVRMLVYLAAITMIIQSLTQFFQSIFRAFGKMEYEALSRVVFSAVSFLASFAVILLNFGIIPLVLCSVIASFFTFFTSFFFTNRKLGRFRVEFDRNFLNKLAKESFPFFLSSLFVSIYWYIDVTMLSLIKSDLVVGWYTAASKLIFLLLVIPSIVFSTLFPISSRLYQISEEKLKAIFQKSFEYMAIIAIPLAVGTTIIAGKIIDFLYGSEFGPSVYALQILIWGGMFAFMAIPFENLFSSINKQYVLVKEFGLAALINIVLNLFLIPRYSFKGAAVATLAVWFFEFIYLFLCLRRTRYFPESAFFKKILLKISMATVVMVMTMLLLKNWHLLLIIGMAVLVYFSFLYLFDTQKFRWSKR